MWSHFTFGIPPVVTSARCFRKRSSGLNKPKTLYGEKNPDGEGQEAKSSFTTPTRPPCHQSWTRNAAASSSGRTQAASAWPCALR
jgi:hypothetical protein